MKHEPVNNHAERKRISALIERCEKEQTMEKIYRVQMNSKGMPNFSTAVEVADRPQGEVDAVEIYERAEHNLEQGYITIGEFDERIEPLRHLCYGRPQGEWKGYNADKGGDWLRDDGTPVFLVCDKCYGTVINNGSAHWNYCPNCGARMKGADDE